jgi:hypothetical protein
LESPAVAVLPWMLRSSEASAALIPIVAGAGWKSE